MPRNRQIFNGRTIRQWSGGEISSKKNLPEMQKWVAARVNAGMITSLDATELPLEAGQLVKNAKVLFDKTSRRDALTAFGPAKPNALAILKMASSKEPDGSGHTLRFTRDTVHDLQGAAWINIPGVLNGTDQDLIKLAFILEFFTFANNGVDPIQVIDFTVPDFSTLFTSDPPAPYDHETRFRYITSFYNRIVGAAWRENNEVLLGWSGEYGSNTTAFKGLEDWDPSINETAGFSPLVDSPTDLSDFITGLFGLTNAMVILRERSIWVSTKQASFTAPFNSYSAVPGMGCDSPSSARVTPFGICYLDRRTRTVYNYAVGGQPEPIGRPIERTLLNNITDPNLVFGMYDPAEDSYSVCIPAVGSNLVRTWTSYLKEKNSWTYNEYEGITSFDEVELLTASTTIDDLIGMMDSLVGTYDSLNPSNEAQPARLFGRADGTLCVPDPDSVSDEGFNGGNPYPFDFDLVSKAFTIAEADMYIAKIVVKYQMRISGQLELWYSQNGKTDFQFADAYTPDVLSFNKPQIITFYKVVDAREYAFKLRSVTGQFDVLGYEIWVYPGGQSSMVKQYA